MQTYIVIIVVAIGCVKGTSSIKTSVAITETTDRFTQSQFTTLFPTEKITTEIPIEENNDVSLNSSISNPQSNQTEEVMDDPTVSDSSSPTSSEAYTSQQKAIAIAPKFTAFLSMVGSLCVITMILRRNRNNIQPYHRLILGMSICDFLASTAWFCTTWPIPQGMPGVHGAAGNQGTCTAQGFFAQLSLSTVMYNGSLAIYYVLLVIKGWRMDRIVKIEPYFHAHAIIWGLGTAIVCLFLTLFNPVGWDCWIGAYPPGCKESWENNGVTTCTRGDNGSLYEWVFYYAPLWIVISLVTCLMIWLYIIVRKQERKVSRYSTSVRNTSKQIAIQAFYYVGAFYAAWFFPTIFQIFFVATGTVYYPLLLLTAISVPIQGFFNLIVYLRPNYMKYRREGSFFLTEWFRIAWQEFFPDIYRNRTRNGM